MNASPLHQLPNTYRAFYGAFPALRPFQIEVITPLLQGYDLILQAATGSGKTEAVLAPCLDRWRTWLRAQPRTAVDPAVSLVALRAAMPHPFKADHARLMAVLMARLLGTPLHHPSLVTSRLLAVLPAERCAVQRNTALPAVAGTARAHRGAGSCTIRLLSFLPLCDQIA